MRHAVASAVVAVATCWLITVSSAVAQQPTSQPAAAVRVAYPEEPVVWHPALGANGGQPATVDLAALWGLPLYRMDAWGQLRPGLAASADVRPGDPWVVEITLRPGRWSDGRPVVAADVAATVRALRRVGGHGLEVVSRVEAVDDHTVRLSFARPYGRWPYLLAGGWSVLPAHVLERDGLDAWRDGVPVSGGPFALERHDAGLRAIFRAHRSSPLGAPALERLEVYFTPDYETALGLVADGRVDISLGHLALSPVDRAVDVDGVEAAAPIGGTWVGVRFRDVDRAERPAAREAVSVAQLIEGLLGTVGAPMTSLAPGADGPWRTIGGAGSTTALDGDTISVLLVGLQEALGFTGRVLQRELRTVGADVELVRVEPDDLDRAADAVMAVHRDLPRPSLLGRYGEDVPADVRGILLRADAVGSAAAGVFAQASDALHEEGVELPLYRIGVAHVWREGLSGVRASSWPGLAFWSVGEWTWSGPPPEQAPTLRR